jgi:5-formaminoimidazole-4-carboxamide-1-beta-D-ribofuranosyl 5'-monophosphate synthetase
MTKANNTVNIIRKIRRAEFWYNGEFYIYEFREEANSGSAYLWQGSEKNLILGPHMENPSTVAHEIHAAIRKEVYQIKPKN